MGLWKDAFDKSLAAVSGEYIFCTNCGKRLESSARFCDECGTQVKT